MKTLNSAVLPLIVLCLCTMLHSPSCSAENKVVIVQTGSGEKTFIKLDGDVTAYIDNNDIVIHSHATELRYPLAEGITFSIGEDNESAIIGTRRGGERFTIKDHMCSFAGLKKGETVLLYSSDGLLLDRKIADANGTLSMSLAKHKNKIVVVKTNNKSLKIISK